MAKIFIDGSAGTTGLRIHERLSQRKDIELITLPEELKKDNEAKKEAFSKADAVFLCLPDCAAKEAVTLIEGENTAVIDTSTAHRVAEGWTYGFPEIGGLREKIMSSKRIANPGCHAGGFISLVAPLTENGLIRKDEKLICFSITGYSGGGKQMIAEYESAERDPLLDAPRLYGISQTHKHLPEMKKLCSLENAPVFCPVVAPFFSGMEVTVQLFSSQIKGSVGDIERLYEEYYKDGLVKFVRNSSENGFLSACKYEGRDDMEITVLGSSERILLVSRFDNLGKGASGAAIQNMNLLLGLDEKTGLCIG